MSNPRNRNRLSESASNTRSAKLPAIPAIPAMQDKALYDVLVALKERSEVREGARGNPFETMVTRRDLVEAGLLVGPTIIEDGASEGGSVMVVLPSGQFKALSIDEFSARLLKTKLYKNLQYSLSDPARFGDLPEEVRALVSNAIAEEAALRGADIRQTEFKLQSATRSLAYRTDELTASVAGASAGVREVRYSFALDGTASAGRITTIEARLDDVGGVTIEESMIATADRVEGLSGEYMMKINAGKAAVGFGLAASEDPSGATQSAFIVQAGKFALVGNSEVLADPANPPLARVPFGVDTESNTIYLNGNVRINANGPSISQIGRSVILSASSTAFKVNTSGVASPSSITLTATPSAGLSGTAVFTILSGTATLSGSGLTRSLSYGDMASDAVTVRVSITADGETYLNDLTLYKAFDGSAGTTGSPGSTGASGSRGSVTRYGSGYWSDYAANALLPGPAVIGDTVTLSTGSSATTKYWSGGSWVDPGVVINGNLLVNGTLSASALIAGVLTGFTIQTASSGERLTLNDAGNRNQILGYDASNVQRFRLEGTTGHVAAAGDGIMLNITSSSNHAIRCESYAPGYAAISGGSGSYDSVGVVGRSNGAAGVEGRSITNFGGAFYGGSNSAPLYINPTGSLPSSGAILGALCVVDSQLYFHNGSLWKQVLLL